MPCSWRQKSFLRFLTSLWQILTCCSLGSRIVIERWIIDIVCNYPFLLISFSLFKWIILNILQSAGVRHVAHYLDIRRTHIDSGAHALSELIQVALLALFLHVIFGSHQKLMHVHHVYNSRLLAMRVSAAALWQILSRVRLISSKWSHLILASSLNELLIRESCTYWLREEADLCFDA